MSLPRALRAGKAQLGTVRSLRKDVNPVSYARIGAVVEQFHNASVCCVGDVMLDHFVYGTVIRISPEAPVPVLRIERQQSMLGGAGNAVRNLTALACAVRFFSVTGEDRPAAEIHSMLNALPRAISHLETDRGRETTTKTRYVAGSQQIMRADLESSDPVPRSLVDSLCSSVAGALSECDVLLLSDYAKGLLAAGHAQRFIQIARDAGKPVIVDPKGLDFHRYDGATLIKPNLKELGEAVGLPVATAEQQEAAAHRLAAQIDVPYLLVTCGAAGMLLLSRPREIRRLPALAREVFDVSGAGDTVAAVLAAALASGADIYQAAAAANLAAGIAVAKRGTAVVTTAEITHELQQRSLATIPEEAPGHDSFGPP